MGLEEEYIEGFSSTTVTTQGAVVTKARSMASSLVLKPQSEGGGMTAIS
jgi:hypothetical protein